MEKKTIEEIREEVKRELMEKYDRAFRRVVFIWIMAFCVAMCMCASGAPQKTADGSKAKVIELKAPKKHKAQHDSITGAYVQTDKGTFSVFRGPKGGIYYWQGGKKRYLPKSFKSQIK